MKNLELTKMQKLFIGLFIVFSLCMGGILIKNSKASIEIGKTNRIGDGGGTMGQFTKTPTKKDGTMGQNT